MSSDFISGLPSQFMTAKSLSLSWLFFVFLGLHGLPNSIVSDRDPLFLSEFWEILFKIVCTRFHISTAYQPQSDECAEGQLMP